MLEKGNDIMKYEKQLIEAAARVKKTPYQVLETLLRVGGQMPDSGLRIALGSNEEVETPSSLLVYLELITGDPEAFERYTPLTKHIFQNWLEDNHRYAMACNDIIFPDNVSDRSADYKIPKWAHQLQAGTESKTEERSYSNDIPQRMVWPFKDMGINEYKDFVTKEEYRKARDYAHVIGNKHGKKFVCRWLDDHGRIWRVL